MKNLIQFLFLDFLKSRFIIGYLFLLFLLSAGLFVFTEDPDKGMLGIGNIILLIVPLTSSLFTTISLYNSFDFTRVLLTQTLSRNKVFIANVLAINMALVFAFLFGVGIPFIAFAETGKIFVFLFSGLILSIIFCNLSAMVVYKLPDKVKGIGTVLFIWLYFSIIYDGLMLLFVQAMSDYPIEEYAMGLCLLNPIDMCRILIMFSMDISVLMGLTGAVIQQFLGSTTGFIIISFSLIIWMIVPFLLAKNYFGKKDF
ncbi:MAG: ABC transporter permease [Bacteroidia bacterium]